jgi:hypothetical protein
MRTFLLTLSAACLLAASASAQTETPAPTTPATDAKPAPSVDKLVCVDPDLDSSSHLRPRRICHTQAEWDKLQSKGR